jgi:hypothetical protein
MAVTTYLLMQLALQHVLWLAVVVGQSIVLAATQTEQADGQNGTEQDCGELGSLRFLSGIRLQEQEPLHCCVQLPYCLRVTVRVLTR